MSIPPLKRKQKQERYDWVLRVREGLDEFYLNLIIRFEKLFLIVHIIEIIVFIYL